MRNFQILGLIVLIAFAEKVAFAQSLANGSFTAPPIPSPSGPITDWNTSVGIGGSGGTPSISFGPGAPNDGPIIPVPGTNQVLINSTGGHLTPADPQYPIYGSPNAVSALPGGPLTTFLGVASLPNSANGGAATNGEAIEQTFTTPGLGSARISFYYSYQSREAPLDGADGTGYVLNGKFTLLADTYTNPNGQILGSGSGFFEWALPYQKASITVGPGVNDLGIVAYNTGDIYSPTGVFVDGFIVIPLFGSVQGLTPNQTSVANYIDTFNTGTTTGPFGTLITNLTDAASVSELASDLDQLSPQSLQIFRTIAFDNTTFNTLEINNHLANLRDGLTGFDPSQLSVNDTGQSPGASQISNRLRDAKQMYDPKEMRDPKELIDSKEMSPASSEPANRWSAFIAGQVILANLDHDDQDLAHQDYTTGSVMVGADYRIDDHFTVGALVDFSHTDANLDHIGSTGTVDSYSPGIYASYVDGPWYGNALVTYGYNTYTDDRNIAIGTLTGTNHGATDGDQYTGSLTGGYEFQSGDFKYGPIAGVQYVHLDINSFTEQGPTALNVDNQSADSFRSQLGFEARYITRCGSVWLTPHASVSWQHEYLDDSSGISSQFNSVGAGSFTVQTTTPDRDSAVIDVGLNAAVCKDVTLFTDYETEVSAGYLDQSVQAGVSIGF